MVRPVQRRALVSWAREQWRLSERRACRAVGVARAMIRYRSRRPSQEPLRARLRELATTRVSYGSPRLYVLLRREGWKVNHKRVERLYNEEGLTLRRKRPRRRRSAVQREAQPAVTARNQQWAMDFVHDVVSGGRSLRILAVVDVFNRECVVLDARRTFKADDVVTLLTGAAVNRGAYPQRISVDNGTEFTSRSADHWAYFNRVKLDFSRPGEPTDNAFIESFNASLRRECLSQHWFIDEADARRTLAAWKEEYNNVRPHSSLQDRSPAHIGVSGDLDQPRLSENS